MSTKSVGKAKGGVSHFHFSALLAAVLAISAMGPSNASAISGPHCPTIVNSGNTPFTLPWNVGPCTGTGAAVILTDPGVQLNLNGHRIIGTNPPTPGSIGVEVLAFDQVVGGPAISPANGPGTVTGFDTAILFDYDNSTLTHVHLIRNNTGISSGGGNTIAANTLKDNFCLGIGSYPFQINPDSIVNNLIAGSNGSNACPGGGVGIDIGGGDQTYGVGVSGNAVYQNTTGMHADLSHVAIGVSGNNFSRNSLSGASIENASEPSTVSGNWFDSNGQDGLSLNNVFNGSLVQNNFAYGNKRYGIALVGSSSTGYSSDQLTGNVALGNGMYDLYCLNSPGNTWANNTFDTSLFTSCP